MRIVVTGSSGRLGRQVVAHLVSQQHEVICIDIKPPADPLPGHPQTHTVDLLDRSALTPLFSGADGLCHMGNLPGFGGKAKASAGFQNNVSATFNVFDAAEEAGIRMIVLASSIQVYGVVRNDSSLPLPAPAYLPVDESHPIQPVNPYAISKCVGEMIGSAAARRRPDLTVWMLRYTWIADPVRFPNWDHWRAQSGHDPGWFHMAGALSSFVRAEEAAEVAGICLRTPRPGATAVNIASPVSTAPWSNEDFIKVYGKIPAMHKPIGPAHSLLDCSLAERLLGFRAKLPVNADVVSVPSAG